LKTPLFFNALSIARQAHSYKAFMYFGFNASHRMSR